MYRMYVCVVLMGHNFLFDLSCMRSILRMFFDFSSVLVWELLPCFREWTVSVFVFLFFFFVNCWFDRELGYFSSSKFHLFYFG